MYKICCLCVMKEVRLRSMKQVMHKSRHLILLGVFAASFLSLIIFAYPQDTVRSASTVTLNPGDSIQAAVNANPAGTIFVLNAGEYRMQSVVPKQGNVFSGMPGAVLNGSRVLTGWTASGSAWKVGGQTQQGTVNGTEWCLSGYPRCAYPEDLFIDDKPMLHVGSLSAVGPGKWFFDYGADTIYIGDNPSGHKVEVSVTPRAFGGGGSSVTDVVIKGLTIEKYAAQLQLGAIDSETGGARWTIEGNIIRLNHGYGINAGPATKIIKNKILDNGQAGYGGGGTGFLFDSNEIARNGWYAGVNPGWEGGAGKITDATSGTVSNNCVYENRGPGIWQDENADNILVENNVVWGNTSAGIMLEISTGGIVRNNTVFDNGTDTGGNGWLWSPQILLSSVYDMEVYNNTVDTNANYGNGITIVSQDRGSANGTSYSTATGNIIRNNKITLRANTADLSKIGMDAENVPPSNANTLANNTYHVVNINNKHWWWPNSSDTTYTLAGMKAIGQESGSTIDTSMPAKPVKSCAFLGTTTPPPPPTPAPTISLGVNPTSVAYNGSATLSWNTTNATACTASGNWTGAKALSGSQAVSGITENKVYMLTCTGAGGSAEQFVPLTVNQPAPSTKFISGAQVQTNTGVNVRNPANGTLLGTQSTGAIGTVIGGPVWTGGYFWWNVDYASGVDGWSAEEYLNAYTPPTPTSAPTVSLTANPTTVTSGGSTVLTWSSTNASSCTASGSWTGAKATAGSATQTNITTAKTYTIACTGAGGTANASASVAVSATPPSPPDEEEEEPDPTPQSTKLKVGEQAEVTERVRVRSTAGTSGVRLGYQPTGATGTVVDGPVSANGYVWWKLDYTNAPDGWSIEDDLIPYSAPNPDPEPEPEPGSGSLPSPVGYWKFDERVGALVSDSSGNENDGGLNQYASFTIGKFGNALLVDGEPDGASLSSASDLDSLSFTMSMWVKVNGWNGSDNYVNLIAGRERYDRTGFRFGFMDEEYKPTFWTEESGGDIEFSAPQELEFGQFYHLAVTYNDTTNIASIYINGSLAATQEGSYLPPAGRTLGLGSAVGGAASFDGVVDDVRYFDQSLSAGQIQELYTTVVSQDERTSLMASVLQALVGFPKAVIDSVHNLLPF